MPVTRAFGFHRITNCPLFSRLSAEEFLKTEGGEKREGGGKKEQEDGEGRASSCGPAPSVAFE